MLFRSNLTHHLLDKAELKEKDGWFTFAGAGKKKKVLVISRQGKQKALDYIIKKYYSSSFYKGMNPDWLDNNASPYVVEMEVE